MDPPEGQAQGPTVKNTPAVDPALGVGLDGDIDGIRDHGALVVRTGASMDGGPARPARESFAASDAPDASRETSFASGQSRGKSGSTPSVQQQQGWLRSAGPLSGVGVGVGGGGGDGGGGDAAAGDDDMTDKADTVGLEWGVDRGDGGGVGDEKKGAVSTSKDVGAGGPTPQRQDTSKISRGRPLPELKQASPQPTGTINTTGRGSSNPPTSRLQFPKANKQSPSVTRSRNSSVCSSPKSPPTAGLSGSLALHTSPAGSLSESFDAAAMGERTGPGGRRRVSVTNSPPSGVNFRAVGSPGSSASFSRAPQGERRKSAPAYGGRGRGAGSGAGSRSPHSHGGSARTSPSPDAKRSSMSFGDFVASSNTELSLLESSRASTGGGKRTRDRNALRVAVRVRPLIEREKGSRMVTCDGGSGRMVVVNPKKFKASADAVLATASAVSRANMATADWLRPFDFDKVFWSTPDESTPNEPSKDDGEEGSANVFSTQQSVYEGLGERIVEDVLNGVNCSCFAYGHTGSGKTYSMFGCGSDAVLQEDGEALEAPPVGKAFGLVPRVCFHLLRRLHETNTGAPTPDRGTPRVGLSVQFIEIYNDKIRDLLHPGADSSAFRVREHPHTGPYVDNLVPVQVESWSQLRQLLVLGSSARTEADTPENSKSSRGHAILTLEVGTPAGPSRVQMVDLAGSEREVSTRVRVGDDRGGAGRGGGGSGGGDVGGRPLPQRLRETAQIKKALSNLGIIIKGLSKGSTPVGLPFRDSVLTWLLKEALSGRAHTTMLATISPSSNNYVETMNTLKYAERLRRASAHLNWHKDATGPPIGKPSDCMKEEMENLVKKLGADGVEAKRQVLYQTVSDPQQRIAKLTAKDPRRRRTSSGGSSLPFGGPRQDLGLGPGPRRTSFPGTAGFMGPATPQRFGWNPATPTRHIGDKPRSNSDHAIDGAKAWGSPIVMPDDLSMEGAPAGSGVGVGTGTPDVLLKPGVGAGNRGADANVTGAVLGTENSRIGGRAYQPGGTRGGGLGYESDPKLYSDTSESEDDEEDGGYGDGGRGNDGGDNIRHGFGGDVGDDAGDVDIDGDDVGEDVKYYDEEDDVKEYVEEDDVKDYVDDAAHIHAGGAPAASATHKERQTSPAAGNRLGVAGQSLAEQAGQEAEQGRNPEMSIATGARPDGDDVDAHTVSTDEEHSQSWPPSPEGGTAPIWAGTSSSETSRSPGSERETNSKQRAESCTVGGVGDAAVAVVSSNPLGSLPADASEPSDTPDTASTGSGGGAWREASDPLLSTTRVGDARGSGAQSKRITWAEEQGDGHEEDREGEGGAEWRAHEEESGGHAGHRSSGVGVGAGHGGRQRTEGHTPDYSRSDEQLEPLDRGGSRRSEGVMNLSVESGGGASDLAAALAASGVFDATGTSADTEENGNDASDGDADSLEGTGAQGGAWTSQRQQRERRREREGRQTLASGDGSDDARGGGTNDDVGRIIDDLMRQIDQLKAANTALREEMQRLREELRRSKDSEEEAWAIGDDTSQEFRSRLASIQRQLDDQTARARDAERDAREADKRAESVLEVGPSDTSRLLDEARRRTKEAEQRATEAETREEELRARAEDADARLEASQVALEEQTAAAEGAKADAKQIRATLEAGGGDVDVGAEVAAAHRAIEKERLKTADAEARASRAVAKAGELSALIDEQDEHLARARKALLEEGARADGAEVRERRSEARTEELEGLLNENEKRLARVREAFEAEGTRADEAIEERDAAERRIREVERDTERRQTELEQAKNEAEASLAAEIVAAGAEKKRIAARMDAVIAERDRGLEQIEAERTEVLRLSSALNGLRSTSRQDAKAAADREAGLKAVLASESEASRAEQAEVEQLLSLIASPQGTEGGDGGVDDPPAVSVSGARFAIEAQRAKHEAARRRLQALEDENHALRRSKAENQAESDRLRLVEEERDFLLREKDSLDERLQSLELRQQAFQQREKKAGHQDGDVAREKQLEAELRGLEEKLSEEVDLRAKEALDFANRLKEKDEQAAEQLSKTLKQVMDGVKSQAGHIRGTVAQLEKERDRAIDTRNDAKREVEDVRCQLESMQREKADAASDFDAQMQQSARERAALWLAVNKLDVLEAAKDAAIKDLQTEGEDKSRELKRLEAHNAGLTRELGQVDMSLMQALEDNGLTLDSVKLQNTPTSRRVSRRRLASNGRSSITNGHATGNPPAHPQHSGGERDDANPAVDAHGRMPGRTRSIRSSAIAGAFAVDDAPPSHRPQGGAVPGKGRESARRHSSFHAPRAVDNRNSDYQEEEGEGEEVRLVEEREEEEEEVVARGSHARTGRRDSAGRRRNGQEFERGTAFENGHAARGMGERRRTYNGSASSSLQADSWDPAINTIEREIEQLSERLSGQPHRANSNSSTRLRRASSQDDLPEEESFHGRDGREQGSVAKGMGVTSGTVGKRLRVRSSAVVSPPKKTPPQVRKRERGGLV